MQPRTGLKSQHFTSIRWLADACDAEVQGLEIGSRVLTFSPRRPPTALLRREFLVSAESSAASALLILQAILPYLLFAGGVSAGDGADADAAAVSGHRSRPHATPIEVEISGGTNVSFSLSYEYLDQILLPALHDRFGIVVERRLVRRGWSLGQQSRGSIWIRVHPLSPGQTLRPTARSSGLAHGDDLARGVDSVTAVDASIVAPAVLLAALQGAVSRDVASAFSGAETHFVTVEDSGHDSRIYVFLVARTAGSLRWGRDVLMSTPKAKGRKSGALPAEDVAAKVARQVCRDLRADVAAGGEVDEHLQDQLVCFQALAEGVSAVVGGDGDGSGDAGLDSVEQALKSLAIGESVRKDRSDEPFGSGSLHTRTARWIASEILPGLKFYHGGNVCEGAGVSFAGDVS
jgi:RNA 3'-terminal phosphate cyclase (ATP)